MRLDRWRRLLPGLWAGWLLCVALLAAPAAFALLPQAEAGRLVSRMLAQEAYTSLGLGVLLLVLERLAARRAVAAGTGSQFSLPMVLAIATLFCTIAGYFALQPLMEAARAGHGPLSFGQLHAVSVGFYLVKLGLVATLAWRASFKPATSS
jgi:cytochrome b561